MFPTHAVLIADQVELNGFVAESHPAFASEFAMMVQPPPSVVMSQSTLNAVIDHAPSGSIQYAPSQVAQAYAKAPVGFLYALQLCAYVPFAQFRQVVSFQTIHEIAQPVPRYPFAQA